MKNKYQNIDLTDKEGKKIVQKKHQKACNINKQLFQDSLDYR